MTPRIPAGLRPDLASGLCAFLLALPLSLGIAVASGCPPTAGLITAGLGSLIVAFTRPDLATIKGPAAGLVVVVLAAITELGMGDPILGYRRMLAAALLAGLLQLALSYTRFGVVARRIPRAAVDGMLMAIGSIIIVKQLYPLVGASTIGGTPLESLQGLAGLDASTVGWTAALVGLVGVVVLLGWEPLTGRLVRLGALPGPIVALLVTLPLGLALGLDADLRLDVPDQPWTSMVLPEFDMLWSWATLRHALMLALVGSLESSLTVVAVEPGVEEQTVARDLRGVALGNVGVSLVGGLPMISEVVRSRANLEAGAQSWRSGAIHGALLLACWWGLPAGLRLIPLAALAAMLVVVGGRLIAGARLGIKAREAPRELIVVLVTFGLTFATDLLIGVAGGWIAAALLRVRAGETE